MRISTTLSDCLVVQDPFLDIPAYLETLTDPILHLCPFVYEGCPSEGGIRVSQDRTLICDGFCRIDLQGCRSHHFVTMEGVSFSLKGSPDLPWVLSGASYTSVQQQGTTGSFEAEHVEWSK